MVSKDCECVQKYFVRALVSACVSALACVCRSTFGHIVGGVGTGATQTVDGSFVSDDNEVGLNSPAVEVYRSLYDPKR